MDIIKERVAYAVLEQVPLRVDGEIGLVVDADEKGFDLKTVRGVSKLRYEKVKVVDIEPLYDIYE